MEQSLMKYDKMVTAIAECRRVDDAKKIRDKATAWAVYMRQANNLEAERELIEIRLRAERRCGELLIEMGENGQRAKPGDAGGGTDGTGVRPSVSPTLDDLGIGKKQSAAWQQLARMPENEFNSAATSQKPITAVRLYFTPSKRKSFDWWEEYYRRHEHDNDLAPFKTIRVHFLKFEDVEAFSRLVGQKIGETTKSIWWPKPAIDGVLIEVMDDSEV